MSTKSYTPEAKKKKDGVEERKLKVNKILFLQAAPVPFQTELGKHKYLIGTFVLLVL